MNNKIVNMVGASFIVSSSLVMADVGTDIKKFQNYFLKQHPHLSLQEFEDGPYTFDADKRQQFEAVMEFPPFEDHLDKGERLWKKPFKNGKTLAGCFNRDVSKVRPSYPYWDSKKSKVITLEAAINDCRVKSGEPKWGWKKGNIAYVSAYLTSAADGQKINVVIPDDPKAQAAYKEGKKFFYAKRGQLNLSCSNCHIDGHAKRIRGNVLSAALGQTTHFPVWRGKWARSSKGSDGFGTLHRRFGGCNKQVRAKPFKAQGKEYANLEYFLTAMSNGMTYNGTAYRE